jgi:hypothetical protein
MASTDRNCSLQSSSPGRCKGDVVFLNSPRGQDLLHFLGPSTKMGVMHIWLLLTLPCIVTSLSKPCRVAYSCSHRCSDSIESCL